MRASTAAIAFTALLVACAGEPPEARGPSETATSHASSNLEAALDAVPRDVDVAAVVDWQAIKAAEGVEVDSDDSEDEHIEFLSAVTQRHQPVSAFALRNIAEHADVWGWDTTDVVWEVWTFSRGFEFTYVLQLRDNIDIAAIVEHFVDRDFDAEPYGDAIIYTHEPDLATEGFSSTEFNVIPNTAIIRDERLIVLSNVPQRVEYVVDVITGAAASLGEYPDVEKSLALSGPAEQLLVLAQRKACDAFTLGGDRPLSPKFHEEIVSILEEAQPGTYDTLLVAYALDGDDASQAVVLDYRDEAAAQRDVDVRTDLLERGKDLQARRSMSTSRWTMRASTVRRCGCSSTCKALSRGCSACGSRVSRCSSSRAGSDGSGHVGGTTTSPDLMTAHVRFVPGR